MVHVPAATIVIVPSLVTVQTDAVLEVKVTAKPADENASARNGASPKVALGSSAKSITCKPALTVNVRSTSAAAA
jgi:hypothetical protein